MPSFRYQALGPLPSPGGSRADLGLAILDETRAEPVVLVWVPEELARDLERSEHLRRDTERAALIEHPHVVHVYGFARLEDGRLARVVEFADGENLRRILETVGPLPAPLAARLIADAAQGVHYAHLAGHDDGTPLLHGDLRPETLLVTFGGQCKVAGYGAAAFAPRESRTRNLYVAPEQVLGGRAAMNVQTDVYLLGATLFECLTGKAPFQDAADFEQAVLTQELELAAYPEIPEALREVIARALAKKAADRFPSAHLLREAIDLAAHPLPDAEEVGRWLLERFPDVDGTRAQRRAVIDRGIAAFVRAKWESEAAAPSAPSEPSPPAPPPTAAPPPAAPAPSAPTAQPAPPPPAPGGPAPAPSAPAPQAAASVPEPALPQPRRPRSSAAVVIGALLIAAGLLLWLLPRRQHHVEELPPPGLPSAAARDAGSAATGRDAGAGAADASTPVDAGAANAKPAAPAAPAGTLVLTVEPPVPVEVDGAPAGHAPVKLTLPAGRHRLHLVDRRLGVDVTRSVVVPPRGETRETITLEKGFVRVRAPAGAAISIDGKAVGQAPLNTEVTLYEGTHRVDVTVGASKWGEPFQLEPNQHVTFDVGPQYR